MNSWNAIDMNSEFTHFLPQGTHNNENLYMDIGDLPEKPLLMPNIEPEKIDPAQKKTKSVKRKVIYKRVKKKSYSLQQEKTTETSETPEHDEIPQAPMFLDPIDLSDEKRNKKKRKKKNFGLTSSKSKTKKATKKKKKKKLEIGEDKKKISKVRPIIKNTNSQKRAVKTPPPGLPTFNSSIILSSKKQSTPQKPRAVDFVPPPPAPQYITKKLGDSQSVAPRLSLSGKKNDTKSIKSTKNIKKRRQNKLDPELDAVVETPIMSEPQLAAANLDTPSGNPHILNILAENLTPTPKSKLSTKNVAKKPLPLQTLAVTQELKTDENVFNGKRRNQKKNQSKDQVIHDFYSFQVDLIDDPDDADIEQHATRQFDISVLLRKLKSKQT